VEKTLGLENIIYEETTKLERIYQDLVYCSIAVERPQEHLKSGNPYQIRLEILAPKSPEIVVSRSHNNVDMHTPLESVMKSAFKVARRRLKKLKAKQRIEIKRHPLLD
jgi:hypothetical protein